MQVCSTVKKGVELTQRELTGRATSVPQFLADLEALGRQLRADGDKNLTNQVRM